MKNESGQVQIAQIITWAVTISIAFAGSLIGSSRGKDMRLGNLEQKVQNNEVEMVKKTATLEEAVGTIKLRLDTIDTNIKEILVRTK